MKSHFIEQKNRQNPLVVQFAAIYQNIFCLEFLEI